MNSIKSKNENIHDGHLVDRMGAVLLERRFLDKVQLSYIKQKEAIEKKPFWTLLVNSGMVREVDISKVFSELLGTEYCDIDKIEEPAEEVLALFNRELCLTNNFLPIKRDGSVLVVLIGDATPDVISQIILKKCGLRSRFLQSEFSEVARLIRYSYYFSANPPEKFIAAEIDKLWKDTDHVYSPEQLLNNTIHLAYKERATDIHITPNSNSLHVLFRIDGVLMPFFALPLQLNRLLGFIKLSSDMDISEQRRPQDGSFRAKVLETNLTIRVSTIITEFGERMVMRLLPESHNVQSLSELGFFDEDVKLLADMAGRPAGLILITGPTGSGKSSTLHAALRMQHLIERNVLTVEDPLEYRVPGAAQTEVNRRAGYDFQTALRHFLRHDPDVILLGEMRDAETALAALESSATGHLVLSTLHVTSVFGVVPRLLPMGLEPSVIAENLLLIINQRLVRVNCKYCIEDIPFSPFECEWLGVPNGTLGKHGKGCVKCRDTGYYGRYPIYEILEITEKLSNAIADDAGREKIRSIAFEEGFKTIGQTAKRRVLLGQTTPMEVYRTIGEGPSR
jgi:type II secretory ATPase GspE/PulE/Tfp pilus assembly ATPase PilB-like protein